MSDFTAKYREWWRKSLREQFGPDLARDRKLYALDKAIDAMGHSPSASDLRRARDAITVVARTQCDENATFFRGRVISGAKGEVIARYGADTATVTIDEDGFVVEGSGPYRSTT